jgi:hypothetical protein
MTHERPPTVRPKPVTKLNTPAGSPDSWMISARMKAFSGATSLGLSTTVQPAARAGATLAAICAAVVPRRNRGDNPTGSRATTELPWSSNAYSMTSLL